MKIESAYIYGFGKWVDFTIDFSHEGLQFVYGENESGKSTLHHFLLFMLFGLPPKERALFRPKKSSKFGGQLVIYDEVFGECIIERLEHQKKAQAVCKTADGKTHDESWLKEQLHGMTTAVYQSIYGFSAMDLAGIEDLKEEDLGEILLGIGFTGASKLHQVEKRLTNQLGELFKPSGKNPKINQELETLQRMQQEIAVYRNEEAVYLEKKQRLKQLEKQEKELQLERSDAQERRLHLEKIQQALSALESYQAAAVKLQQPQSIFHFRHMVWRE
ncbi:AAA family ATPase [Virgibacillus sp. 179-BFC.A HS]|uniref:AAA family ATPase n=1 Tax=Tigheibacillus jepli TaxID=3035914 RepID=A0ABU5CIV7_9BACI|nr:AAA family ATPase [Virgibacillus sp. 179-BFC.A HS]MDY0406254.1 AAA family ATPase [Virgibacillus sp. 179-BFC.A HS]